MIGDSEENHTKGHGFVHWLRQGARSAVFLGPDLAGLRASPWLLVLLTAAVLGLGILLQRLFIAGPALFYGQAVASGWLTTVLLLWACWLVARSRAGEPDAPTLFGMLLLQQIVISVPLWGLYLLLPRLPGLSPLALAGLQQVLPFVVVGWVALAGAVLLLRHAASGGLRALVLGVFALAAAVDLLAPPMQFWYPDENLAASATAVEDRRLHFSQEVLEKQSGVLVDSLNALQPQRPGVIDLYALTFAPYAEENVFRRESKLVAEVMRSRFDAQGHTLQLINHADTAGELPWATGLNLQRAILRAASLMDRNEDILFIHLTSHGAQDGKLSAEFYPLEVEAVTPMQLRAWLDEAGVRLRVISVSACYSGSWIEPLSDPGTLVMTAADATHTSYGCGRKSELTFFGRAMYGEQLRSTHSFEAAHAAARTVIEQREKEAGKTDGYSNPQIAMGELIRPHLAALAARLDLAAR
ncbi:C13 family peptidase [Sphaerotilaceae bacterium SBD11-9]